MDRDIVDLSEERRYRLRPLLWTPSNLNFLKLSGLSTIKDGPQKPKRSNDCRRRSAILASRLELARPDERLAGRLEQRRPAEAWIVWLSRSIKAK